MVNDGKDLTLYIDEVCPLKPLVMNCRVVSSDLLHLKSYRLVAYIAAYKKLINYSDEIQILVSLRKPTILLLCPIMFVS